MLIYAGEKPYTLYTEEDLQKFPVIRVEPEYEIPYLFYDLLYVAYLVFDCYISSGLDGAAIQGNSLLEQMFSTVCAYEGEALTRRRGMPICFYSQGYRLKRICCL